MHLFQRAAFVVMAVAAIIIGAPHQPASASVSIVTGANGISCATAEPGFTIYTEPICQLTGTYSGNMSVSGTVTTPALTLNPTSAGGLTVNALSTTNNGSDSAPMWFSRALPGGSPSSATYNGIAFRGIVAQDMGIYTKADDDSIYVGHWPGSGAWQDEAQFSTSGQVEFFGTLVSSPTAINYSPSAGDIIAARGAGSACYWGGYTSGDNGAMCWGVSSANAWSWSNAGVSNWEMSLTNTGALSTASTITAGGEIYGPALSITGGGQGVGANANINGDLTVERGGPSGVVYYGNQGAYLYYDGTNWTLNSSNGADTFSLPGVHRETFGGSAHTYGAVTIRGETNSWSGINFEDNSGNNLGTLMFEAKDTGGAPYWGIYNQADNGWMLQIDGSGNTTASGAFYANSRLALKKDVHPLTQDFDPLKVITHINWVGYHYKKDKPGTDMRYGFIADYTDSHLSGKKHDHFDIEAVAAADGAAIKELNKKVDDQAREIAALKAHGIQHHRGWLEQVWYEVVGG